MRPGPCRRLLATLLLLLAAAFAWAQTTPAYDEEKVKAAFLMRFADFVQWPPSVVPDPATPLRIGAKRLNIQAGSRATVKGRADAPGTVKLQIQRRGRWVTLDRARTGRGVPRQVLVRPRLVLADGAGGVRERLGPVNLNTAYVQLSQRGQ